MRKLTIGLIAICFFYMSTIAQEKDIQIMFGADTGYSKMEFNEQTINASTSGASAHILYGVSKYFSIESGIDYFITQGNLISTGNSYFIENQYISIPVGLNTKIGIGKDEDNVLNQKFAMIVGTGLYSNYLFKSKVKNFDSKNSVGWNFGFYGNVGFNIDVNSNFSIGVGILRQNDFSAIEDVENLSIRQNRNSVYLDFGVKL